MTSPYITQAVRACQLPISVQYNPSYQEDGVVIWEHFYIWRDYNLLHSCGPYANEQRREYVNLRNRLLSEKESQ